MATRAQDSTIQALVVEVLNEYYPEVRAAQDDPANKKLLDMLLHEGTVREQQCGDQKEAQPGAQAVTDSDRDVDAGNIIHTGTKRIRNRPEQFGNVKWSDGGATVGARTGSERCAYEGETLSSDDIGMHFSPGSRCEHDV